MIKNKKEWRIFYLREWLKYGIPWYLVERQVICHPMSISITQKIRYDFAVFVLNYKAWFFIKVGEVEWIFFGSREVQVS